MKGTDINVICCANDRNSPNEESNKMVFHLNEYIYYRLPYFIKILAFELIKFLNLKKIVFNRMQFLFWRNENLIYYLNFQDINFFFFFNFEYITMIHEYTS